MKFVHIEHPTITSDNIIARVVEFEDGTGEIQTYFRPSNEWTSHGMDAGTQMISPEVTREFLEQEGFKNEEISVILEGVSDD